MRYGRILALSVVLATLGATGAPTPSTPPAGAAGGGAPTIGGTTVLRGQTEPAAKVEVPSAVRGVLAEMNVKEGQTVHRGQQLARVDDDGQKQRVAFERVAAEATAEIRYAENQVEFAALELKRFLEVAQNSGPTAMITVPPLEIKQKELALNQAKVAVEGAKDKQKQAIARLREEELTLERMTIRSPIEGQVLAVKKQAGEMTDDGPVVIVVQTSRLNAIFYPAKDLFGKIVVGDKVGLELEGVKRDGVVAAVDPIIDPASQIFRVKVEVDNADGKLAAGVTAVWRRE